MLIAWFFYAVMVLGLFGQWCANFSYVDFDQSAWASVVLLVAQITMLPPFVWAVCHGARQLRLRRPTERFGGIVIPYLADLVTILAECLCVFLVVWGPILAVLAIFSADAVYPLTVVYALAIGLGSPGFFTAFFGALMMPVAGTVLLLIVRAVMELLMVRFNTLESLHELCALKREEMKK